MQFKIQRLLGALSLKEQNIFWNISEIIQAL